MSVPLREIAHARAGDKGNLNTIAVIAREEHWYPVLCEVVTPDLVREVLADRVRGPVEVHRVDGLRALIVVCARAWDDTVTTSVHLDTHGKTLAGRLLGARVALPGGRAGSEGRPVSPSGR
ncbi:hypothetical protein [Nocardiopsis sp. MG754419]|uniref:AtuA-related protein n=1 Tax=Nocardiopsis sp. MG754419 TaxID=2259865 RepID=UPI001BA65E1B|nr:hypothetical protein [Nocardiopsis sp. MG754419]MBR8743249.1 hypothetical protein [Nocardiopsis sp. MG754419]